jgi:hypothetical protein
VLVLFLDNVNPNSRFDIRTICSTHFFVSQYVIGHRSG